MVVDKALYARSLQAPTLRRLAEKQAFINKSPFFSLLSARMKRLLVSYFERDVIPFESYLGKQGDYVDRIYFIMRYELRFSFSFLLTRAPITDRFVIGLRSQVIH